MTGVTIIDKKKRQPAGKRGVGGIFLLVLAIGLAAAGCEYNYFESGGTLTIVNKTMIDYNVTVMGRTAVLTPGSRKSWDFSEDVTAEFNYTPVGFSASSARHTTRIEYGVKKIIHIVYED
jgi:hypothetical protein